jgi:signal transduction histidine kinase
MGSFSANRHQLVYAVLIGGALAICGWQVEEHVRFGEHAKQTLVNRGNDITEVLRIVVRSQPRRFGPFVTKERLESALNEFIRPDELGAIAFLSASGDPVARAGKTIEVTPAEIAQAHGVLWRDHTLTLINLTNWDSLPSEDGAPPRLPLIVGNRPTPPTADPASNPPPAAGNGGSPRRTFGRPMSKEEFDAMVQKQGVQSIVISLSTAEMERTIRSDLWLRSLVSLFAVGGAIISSLAWRNVAKNSELQIRLIKAGEMNTHLKEMNLAAAGLAHETRNPLNIIRGLAQMIAMEAGSAPKLKEHAATVIEEADRVAAQLNEFINYSKPREPQVGPVAVQRLVADVARTLLPDIEEKQITLRQPETEIVIEADQLLLRQALFNVLLNAVQAVGSGGAIEVKINAVGPREAMLEITDDGPGVDPENRLSIFKPYVTMREKGVGLGLAIVQQIAAVHHWEVVCVPNEPRGAVFRFRHLKIASSAT